MGYCPQGQKELDTTECVLNLLNNLQTLAPELRAHGWGKGQMTVLELPTAHLHPGEI